MNSRLTYNCILITVVLSFSISDSETLHTGLKPIRVVIYYSLEGPSGGVHFVRSASTSSSAGQPNEDTSSTSPTGEQRSPHAFTCTYLESTRLWLPCVDSHAELCTWRLEFTLPVAFTVVASGELVDTVLCPHDSSLKTCYFELRTPTAPSAIGFCIGYAPTDTLFAQSLINNLLVHLRIHLHVRCTLQRFRRASG